MALAASFVTDRGLAATLEEIAGTRHELAHVRTWKGLLRTVRERPTTLILLDLCALRSSSGLSDPVLELRSLFPRQPLVALVHEDPDPSTLFRLGRSGVREVFLLRVTELEADLMRVVYDATRAGPVAVVTRTLSPFLPGRELRAVYTAMEDVHRLWNADEFAARIGLSRPFLSERFKRWGLPSVGHFLIWSRLFHAAEWLTEPGRTGESVSRQLGYSSGAAFRRALRNYVGMTATEVAAHGGLPVALRVFLERCGFTRTPAELFSSLVA